MTTKPTTPVRAHHRLMMSLVKSGHKKDKVSPTPKELNRVAEVFRLAGGSWERLFKGSIEDMNLLKRTIKVAAGKGVFTKTLRWD